MWVWSELCVCVFTNKLQSWWAEEKEEDLAIGILLYLNFYSVGFVVVCVSGHVIAMYVSCILSLWNVCSVLP